MVNVDRYIPYMEHMGMVWFLKQVPSQTEGSEKRRFIQNSGATDDKRIGL